VQIGRWFEPGEDQPGRDRVAILGHELWARRFGSDPAAIGRMIAVDGVERRIVGIMPAGFALPSARVQLWMPAPVDPRNQVDYWAGEFTPLIARLRPGTTIDQARDETKRLAADVWRMFPWPMPRNWNANATVIPLQTDLAGDTRGRLLVLVGAVAAMLVIACANVAGLLAARGAARRKEIAMRAALGAGQFRIVRQLLTESVILAGAAGAVGLLLGCLGLRLFRTVVSADLPAAARIGIDWRVAAFAAALAIAAGISFGIAPAVSASRLDLLKAMKSGGQRSATASSVHFRSWLIAGEVALTLMLVIGSALLLRTLYAFSTVNPGFDRQRLLSIKISPESSFCKEPGRCIAFYDRMLHEVRGVTGVVDAAVANDVPLDGSASSIAVDVEDHPRTAEFPSPVFWAGAISPGYLRVMAVPLLSGRSFNDADTREAEPVVMIDASTAMRFWPGRNPVGKHLKAASEKRWRTVVGVVADVRQYNLANRPPAGITGAMYMPYAQAIDRDDRLPEVMNLVVKTGSYAPQVADELHRSLASLNPDIPVSGVVRLDRIVDDSLSGFRSTTWLILGFAAAALALAAVGIYGLVSYSVAQRGYEIALRMSIGATAGGILWMILARSLRVTALGLSAGIVGAVVVARGLSAALSDVAASGPLVYALVTAFLLAVAVAASLVPAVHAARIDPVRALRAE
jgi:putative ABC transport system permease protein